MGLFGIFKGKKKDEVTQDVQAVAEVESTVNVAGSLNLTKGESLNLTKGNVVSLDFTKSNGFDKPLTNLEFASGWDTCCDLDIYCTLGDASGTVVKVVYFGNKTYQGVSLNGVNLTGEGDGEIYSLLI